MSFAVCNVLVVEDDPSVSKALRRKLLQAGHSIESRSHCESARHVVGTFDFAVLDLELPDGNGIDLAADLLARGVVQSAVFYTGAADPALLARAAKVGLVVSKNQSVDELLHCAYQSVAPPPVSELHETARRRPAKRTQQRSS
jgi:DNA-binding response OmpR family regulator